MSDTTNETTTQPPTEEVPEKFRVGYVVALKENGDYIFEVVGEQKGLLELLGIHEYAKLRVKELVDRNLMSGDRLVHEVGKAVTVVNQKIDEVAKVVLPPKKPENTLE